MIRSKSSARLLAVVFVRFFANVSSLHQTRTLPSDEQYTADRPKESFVAIDFPCELAFVGKYL